MNLHGKIALVTGSTGGIGKGIALHLAKLGATVIVTSRTLSTAEKVVEEIKAEGGKALAFNFNIDDYSNISPLLSFIEENCDGLDILVNNALSRVSIAPKPLQKMEYSFLNEGVTANLTNILELTARAYPLLKKKRGVVLNIGSVVSKRHMLGIPLYAIVKGALSQATKVLASEWAAEGVRVNQVNPGFVQTDSQEMRLGKVNSGKFTEQFKQFHPVGRVGEVDDVAALAAYMVSDQTLWMTGAIVDIDGGYASQGISFSTGN